MSIEFADTRMGRRFYEVTMPGIAKGITELNTTLELINNNIVNLTTQEKRTEQVLASIQAALESLASSADVLSQVKEKENG